MKSVFAFEYCDCVYESAFHVVSLHTTKRNAFKALRKHLVAACEAKRTSDIQFGQFANRYKVPQMDARRVREILIED